VVAAAALLALPVTTPVRAQRVDAGELGERIERLRETWRVPGLAVAVVADDSVVLARGFGVRREGREASVDPATLFAIGSTTKAFTSTALATLVGQGDLDWDDRVVDHLPAFELKDPWVTHEITLRDLLAHRSGLPMANLMWLSGELDADELVRRLRHLEPAAGFRAEMTYQNVLYLVAGRILSRVSGLGWAEFVRGKLLEPLGMDRTRTGVAGLGEAVNVAAPHALVEGRPVPVPYRDIDAVGPAGSLLSSATDMARWLRFQIDTGSVSGRQLVDPEALLETRRPQIVMRPEGPLAAFYPDAARIAYGMGWVVSEYRGHTLLDHGGGIDGMTSLVALVPERGLGVAILTNLQLDAPPYWLLYPLLDALLGHDPVDRSDAYRALGDRIRAAVAPEPRRREDAPPSRAVDAYASRYVSAPLGETRVVLRGDELTFRLGRMSGPLEHWHHDTFRIDWTDRAWRAAAGPGWVTFRLDRSGEVDGLELTAIPGESWTFDREGS
jgi:CubicO group peptidase (beta-lactamase class C family)